MPASTPRPQSLALKKRATVGPEANRSTYAMFPADDFPMDVQGWDGWPVNWQTPAWNQLGGGYSSFDPTGYLRRVSTVMTCADLNTRQLASFPIYGRKDDYTRFNLPSWSINPQPEIYSGWIEFSKAAWNSFQLAGEIILYATAFDGNGRPARFVVVDPGRVQIEDVDVDGVRRYWFTNYNGERIEEINPMDILHVPYQILPGEIRGMGPLAWTCQPVSTSEILEKYADEIARYGVHAVLKHPDNLNKKQANDLREGWKTNRQANPGVPAVLTNGAEYEALQMSPKDLALVDLKVMSEQRIASAFGVPPFMIGLPQPGGFTYSNVNTLTTIHWRTQLRPMASSFFTALSRWTLPRGHWIEANRDEYTAPEFKERAETYKLMIEMGAMTVEEVRALERLQPLDESERSQVLADDDD